jgi:hypothetical protein
MTFACSGTLSLSFRIRIVQTGWHKHRSFPQYPFLMTATKRKSATQLQAGAKRAKAATKYAAATQPGIPESTPLAKLLDTMHKHHEGMSPQKGNVVHWFRSDLRLEDNKALYAASQKAQENGASLIALYVVSPQVCRLQTMTYNRIGDIIRLRQFASISYYEP